MEEISSSSTHNVVTATHSRREVWSKHIEFLLSGIGYAVGLGNIWRFPFLAYKYGGGAFLIPYTVMLVICGLPLFFMEQALAQYHGEGANSVFKELAPAFQGLGYAMLMISFLVGIYYNMVIAWSLYYFCASFTSKLPWTDCNNDWNTADCFDLKQDIECQKQNLSFWNKNCSTVEDYCLAKHWSKLNGTHCAITNGSAVLAFRPTRVFSSQDYYRNHVLQMSQSIEDFGDPVFMMVISLLAAWVIVAICLIKGVKSSGKVVYFTALFPYVVLLVFIIHGSTLGGSAQGIYFYMVPTWSQLLKPRVWYEAAAQIFYSLDPGFGGLLTLSSYNPFHNECERDAFLVAIVNCVTSFFSGFAIFSYLGFMAKELNREVSDVVTSGTSLVFIAYPEALSKIAGAQFWSILFFFMLILLGLDSQFTTAETIITAAKDEWPSLRNHQIKVVLVICTVSFLCGLPLCCKGGVYIFEIINFYSAGWSLITVGLVEMVVVAWVYGLREFEGNIIQMIKRRPNIYWRVCWKYIGPVALIALLIFDIYEYTPVDYEGYVLPVWANGIGFVFVAMSVILIPAFMIYKFILAHRVGQPIKLLFKPTEKWWPSAERLNTGSYGS